MMRPLSQRSIYVLIACVHAIGAFKTLYMSCTILSLKSFSHGGGISRLLASVHPLSVPTRGFLPTGSQTIDEIMIANSSSASVSLPFEYISPTSAQKFWTRFALWRQVPWRKIDGKVFVKAKLGGSLTIVDDPVSLFSIREKEVISTLSELTQLCLLGAYDPRIQGLLIDVSTLTCGYAKLSEAKRWIKFFRQSGKPVIGYATQVTEKEMYLARSFSEFYLPPLGNNLDLRGFAASAQFFRESLRKVGIEPQLQRIGKYKSFGDTYLRDSMSEAQREVLSHILAQVSAFWTRTVFPEQVTSAETLTALQSWLWSDSQIKTPYSFMANATTADLLSGVLYADEVEKLLHQRYGRASSTGAWWKRLLIWLFTSRKGKASKIEENYSLVEKAESFNLKKEFEDHPRRILVNSTPITESSLSNVSSNLLSANITDVEPSKDSSTSDRRVTFVGAQTYVSRMKSSGTHMLKGCPIQFTSTGPRIAIIPVRGSIVDGKTSSSQRNVGAQSLIPLLRQVKEDEDIQGVVLQVDSPGGSAMASDMIWKELRSLAKVKPLVASMVDVAASGGYYFAMGCDQIVAEEMTLTGSIGVVFGKFNSEELLSKKLGIKSETLSIGRYAEVYSTFRGFMDEELAYFESVAQYAYGMFVEKAAASRSMSVENLEKVAQGRVWTGKDAKDHNLVDHIGGLWTAVDIVKQLIDQSPEEKRDSLLLKRLFAEKEKKFKPYRVEVVTEKGPGGFLTSLYTSEATAPERNHLFALASDEVFASNLASDMDTLGGFPALRNIGLSPLATNLVKLVAPEVISIITHNGDEGKNFLLSSMKLLKKHLSNL